MMFIIIIYLAQVFVDFIVETIYKIKWFKKLTTLGLTFAMVHDLRFLEIDAHEYTIVTEIIVF